MKNFKNTLLAGCLLSATAFGENLEWMGRQSEVTVRDEANGLRSYTLRTTEQLRENLPPSNTLQLQELPGQPVVRSGSILLDSLFALAISELKDNAVDEISDPGFLTQSCDCFVAGRKWPYVWTRDIAYASYLGLSLFDSERTAESLTFKISPFRHQTTNLQIVQDTGSGGSWPVSTDRVSWILGAERTLLNLPASQKNSFREKLIQATLDTLQLDRIAAFDSKSGLYFGEQSFLDWREQSNPPWTASHVVGISESAAMSTNVLHYLALRSAAKFSRQLHHSEEASTFEHWATDLKLSIQSAFWDEAAGLFRTTTGPLLNRASAQRFDLLAQALAVLSGVASDEQARRIIASYPQTAAGAPVQWPQDPDASIYHNRAIWPFVTSLSLKAAAQVKNPAFFDLNFRTLVRGAALNLSHMENFEFVTLANYFSDAERSGPVVNSHRQLWSVAGFLSSVVDGLFGLRQSDEGVQFQPFIPGKTWFEVFHAPSSMMLIRLTFAGKTFAIELQFPASNAHEGKNGYFAAQSATLNGYAFDPLKWTELDGLPAVNQIRIQMKFRLSDQAEIRVIPASDPLHLSATEYRQLFSPPTPTIREIKETSEGIVIHFEPGSRAPEAAVQIFRDGHQVDSSVQTGEFLDRTANLGTSACYAINLRDQNSGNESHMSAPMCYWPGNSVFEWSALAADWNVSPPEMSHRHGRSFLRWESPSNATFTKVSVPKTGEYGLQLIYSNPGPVNTGITAALRRVRILSARQEVISEGVTVMPHTTSDQWFESRLIFAQLESGKEYRIVVEDFVNMSDLSHFENYVHRGGLRGADHGFDWAGIRFLRRVSSD